MNDYQKQAFPALQDLIQDPTIGEIMVNDYLNVFVEKEGHIIQVDSPYTDPDHLMSEILAFGKLSGKDIDYNTPINDFRLPDDKGRVHIVIPPVALHGPSITLRKFTETPLDRNDLLELGTWSQEIINFLQKCVEGRLNIVVAGGVGSGKTTVMNIICDMIPDDERIITIENASELRFQKPHIVSMESRPADPDGQGEITIQELVISALKMRPDRIILGEARGGEVMDMLQAINTGHDGAIMTMHATNPRDALSRLEGMATMHSVSAPLRMIREQLGRAVDLIVQVARMQTGQRRIVKIIEVQGMEGDVIATNDIFEYVQTDIRDGQSIGYFTPTGEIPRFLKRLKDRGIDIPLKFFEPR